MNMWYIWVVLTAILLVLLANFCLYRNRLKQLNKRMISQNKRLALYLRSGNTWVMTYNLKNKTTQTYDEEGLQQDTLSFNKIANFFNPKDFDKIKEVIEEIKLGKKTEADLLVRGNKAKGSAAYNYFKLNLSILHSNNGVPSTLLAILTNITEERETALKTKDLEHRYQSIFDTNMSDMFYFDENDVLTDINDRACSTLGIADKAALLKEQINLDSFPLLGQNMDSAEPSWATIFINLDDIPESSKMKKHIGRKDTIYYESKTACILDENGKRLCTLVTGIDVSDTTHAIRQQKKQAAQIKSATKRIYDYTDNINNAMGVSLVRIVNYYPDKRTLTVKHNLNERKLEISQLRCIELVDESEREEISNIIKAMDRRRMGMVAKNIKTIYKDKNGKDMYLALNFVPIYNGDTIDHYFGLCRNISELVETEARLKEEMEKAQETELLKSVFMRNMSHEIRTPLNSIVGFAELFNIEHGMDDEALFIDEIKKNTNILLKLINNILFLSRLDANMIEFKHEPTDITNLFKAHCSIGWSKELDNSVTTITECPEEGLLLNIDSQHFSRIVDILAENAALYCKQGTITARCEYADGYLTVSIKDTGVGIDEESKRQLFNRATDTDNVVHCGTKLELIICKTLIEQMGGNLTITSELTKGSTVRFTIPCTRVEMDMTS